MRHGRFLPTMALIALAATPLHAEFVAFTRNHGVAELSIPKKIVAVEEIPVLGTGKIDYVAVEKMAKEAIGG